MYKTNIVELKKAIIDAKIDTIVELSNRTNINRNTLQNILNGKSQPSSQSMYHLASALNLNSDDAGRIFFDRDLHIN